MYHVSCINHGDDRLKELQLLENFPKVVKLSALYTTRLTKIQIVAKVTIYQSEDMVMVLWRFLRFLNFRQTFLLHRELQIPFHVLW